MGSSEAMNRQRRHLPYSASFDLTLPLHPQLPPADAVSLNLWQFPPFSGEMNVPVTHQMPR